MGVMSSLFGPALTQGQYRDNYLKDSMITPQQMMGRTLDDKIFAIGSNAGGMLGYGVGKLLGGQTPEEAQNEQMRGMLGGVNMNDPESLFAAAQNIQGMNPAAAQALVAQATDLQTKQVAQQKSMMDAQKIQAEVVAKEQAAAKEEQLRAELASLPPEASDKDVEAVVRKYGNPDQIFKTLERRQTAEANRIAKTEQEQARLEARQQQQQIAQSIQSLAVQQRQATNSLQQEKIQLQIDAQKQKLAEVSDKKQMALDMNIRHAEKVITDVAAAKELVGFGTTGLAGKAAGLVPGTDAFNLNQRVLTLKANLGFDRLQQMRDASPTGGALGQVAVQELEALQASVGSLEIGQSQAELKKNLEKVEKHYKAWLNAVKGGRGGGLNPQDQQAMDWANANPNDPRAAAIKQRLGAQ
jgi:hypothetical protein